MIEHRLGNARAFGTLADMTTQRRRLYQNPLGDTWYLGRERSGKLVVSLEPGEASAEAASQMEVGAFLADPNGGPASRALLQLIGELVDPAHSPNERQRRQ